MKNKDYINREIEFWNLKYSGDSIKSSVDNSISNELLSDAKNYFEKKMIEIKRNKSGGGVILDYGCGSGEKSFKYADHKWKVVGIDISVESIRLAQERKTKFTEYYIMNCEKMEFADNHFDVILDYGTFSSLDLNIALKELIRVLKPSGSLIAIETLAHNPFANLWRQINVKRKRRTEWASKHILTENNIFVLKNNFSSFEINYFGLLTIFLYPFIKYSKSNKTRKIIEKFQEIDRRILSIKGIRKFGFKTVFIMSNPIK